MAAKQQFRKTYTNTLQSADSRILQFDHQLCHKKTYYIHVTRKKIGF